MPVSCEDVMKMVFFSMAQTEYSYVNTIQEFGNINFLKGL